MTNCDNDHNDDNYDDGEYDNSIDGDCVIKMPEIVNIVKSNGIKHHNKTFRATNKQTHGRYTQNTPPPTQEKKFYTYFLFF